MSRESLQTAIEGRLRPCLDCGVPVGASRCEDCSQLLKAERPHQSGKRTDGKSASARGYDYRWQRLSKRARALQPWCSDCGCPDDLTADHLVWPARTLKHVEVVCRPCNAFRGPLAKRVHAHA